MRQLIIALCLVLALGACQDTHVTEQPDLKRDIKLPDVLVQNRAPKEGRSNVEVKDLLNATLFAGSNFIIKDVHIYRTADPATTVETIDQQFQSTLPSRWVPGDQDRNWNGDGNLYDIDWVSFTPFAIANFGTGADINTEPIYRSMYNKWETGGYCNTVDIDEMTYDFSMGNPSLIIDFGLPSTGLPIADVSVVGFLPAEIFEIVLGSENVLGVAFSFVFVDQNGNPIKTTRGKEDKAFTEVWFNDGFPWAIGTGQGAIDLESVILHEFGHTLNLGHFGILQSFTYDDGTFDLVYQPVNTMNALYIGEPRNFLGPNDKGNYCEAWGSWPWN